MANLPCIPWANGVPGQPVPPTWWDPVDPANDTDLDDPRWVGALQRSYGGGTDKNADFRALYYTAGTQTSLYLRWYIKVDPDPTLTVDNYVTVAFRPGTGGSGLPVCITITSAVPSQQIAGGAGTYSTQYLQKTPGSNWSSAAAVPNWLTSKTRLWQWPGSSMPSVPSRWAVQMVIPVGTGGIDLGSDFGLCFYAQARLLGMPIQYVWPDMLPTLGFTMPDPANNSYWVQCRLGSAPRDPSCDEGGVSLTWADIGTRNPDPHIINIGTTPPPDPQPSNTFYAMPKNNINLPAFNPIPAGSIDATFRLADWGSTVSASDPNWRPIRMVSTTPHGPIFPNTYGTIEEKADTFTPVEWAEYDANRHQCMLVELSSSNPALTFSNYSVVRNMGIAETNSPFRSPAQISVRGLQPISRSPRDVYIYVETVNMPAKVDAKTSEGYKIGLEYLNNREFIMGYGGIDDRDRISTFREMENYVPTCRYHVYHDTGKRVQIKGVVYPVLEPQDSFGYYVRHQGNVLSWELRLEGADKIAENVYLIRVRNNGVATVTTVIHPVEDGDKIEPPEEIVPMPKYRLQRGANR